MHQFYIEKTVETTKDGAERYIEKPEGKAIRVEPRILVGNPAEEIIKLADEMYADVVATSTHGRSGVGRWVFGSVADGVLHKGNTPLLLVRPS
jgi:nucleotide-binding universal stress UspA family protein